MCENLRGIIPLKMANIILCRMTLHGEIERRTRQWALSFEKRTESVDGSHCNSSKKYNGNHQCKYVLWIS